MTTVFVTGVGAIIGYGVLRSLRKQRPDVRLVGSDIYSDAVGQVWCDEFVQAPLTSDAGYLDWLATHIARVDADLLVPGIEQDVDFLTDRRSDLLSLQCKVVSNNPTLVETARDKWSMDCALVALDEPTRIETYGSGTFDDLVATLGLPFLLKPRRGYASKGIVRVDSNETFALHSDGLGNHLIAQKIVGSNDREFTVSVFGDGIGGYHAISSLQRKLAPDGSTAHAVSRDPKDIAGVVERLCAHFKPLGPTNLQFREVDGGWKLLEINPRISSSTSIRAAFGYNEAAMCLDYFLLGIPPTQPPLRLGRASRYIEDVVSLDRNSV
jgi:carbamoyl-phosphate synthase large subunit